jgi:hypothetical protein
MTDFYRVLSFANELAAEFENTYERKEADRSLRDVIQDLIYKKGESIH